MQTRKDLYQAHKLMTQRVALALLQGKPGAAESPLRRTGVGALCGVMVVVLVAAGFGITGLLFKGGARNLEQPGLVLIEKETGAAYSYSAQQKRLIPFLNYTSARLAMSGTSIQRKLVSSRSLAKYPRGPLTGIPGAPESLPTVVRAPWSLCVSNGVSLIGGRDVGGTPLTDTQAVLVRGGPQSWLIWRNTRMRLSPAAARTLTPAPPTPVDERWLNGLPQGPDYAAPTIPNIGALATGPGGQTASVGQIYKVRAVAGSAERWYVQLPDGLSGISETQAGLLLANATAQEQVITPGAAAASTSSTNLYNRSLPESPPRPAAYDPAAPLCAVYPDRSTSARFTVGGSLPAAAPTSNGLDQVILPGGGTFAGTLTAPGRAPQSFSLLTEQGLRHPVPTPDDATKLGYTQDSAAPIPANLLQLFRPGPALTSTAAARPVPATQPLTYSTP
ncbi:type VII secretion protein EccB [Spirillospora sp. NPDC047279]|uniref:type VII secretion protein EccB n=1 Tax=Spirillospora sp. NPDC047279 TaxID=3155478 RepID=UPI0033C84EF2